MFNALMAALPAMLQLIEAGVEWLKASQAHSDDERHAALLQLEARLLATVAKVQAAKPQLREP